MTMLIVAAVFGLIALWAAVRLLQMWLEDREENARRAKRRASR